MSVLKVCFAIMLCGGIGMVLCLMYYSYFIIEDQEPRKVQTLGLPLGSSPFLNDCLSRKHSNLTEPLLAASSSNVSVIEEALSRCFDAKVRALTPFVPRWGGAADEETVDYVVPNVLFYVRFGVHYLFRMEHYLSVLSVDRIMKPEFIIIVGELSRNDSFLDQVIREVNNLFLLPMREPKNIFGKRIKYTAHASDIVRLRTVAEYGGIYIDSEVIVVKSFDPLRKFPFTLGNQSTQWLSNGVILSERKAPFTSIWHESYRTFNPHDWAGHSIRKSTSLARKHPDLVHIEPDLQLPNYMMNKNFYKKNVDWSRSYSLHMFGRRGRLESHFPTTIKDMLRYDCAAGQAMRYVYGMRNPITDSP